MTNDKIYAAVLGRIESGEYPPESKLPTVRELSAEFDVTVWRIHTVMNELEENGFVEKRGAAGTFVRPNISDRKIKRLKNKDSKEILISVGSDYYFIKKGYENIIDITERELTSRGFNISYQEMPLNRHQAKIFVKKAADDGCKSIVLFPDSKEWPCLYHDTDLFLEFPGEIFCFNRGLGSPEDLPFNSLCLDSMLLGSLAAEWTIKKRFENVLVIMDELSGWWFVKRMEGFKRVMGSNAVKFETATIKRTSADTEVGRVAEAFFSKSGGAALIVTMIEQAVLPVYNYLESQNIKAGEDFHILSFEDHPENRHLKKTNVFWNLPEAASLFAEMIAEERDERFRGAASIVYRVKPVIIERR